MDDLVRDAVLESTDIQPPLHALLYVEDNPANLALVEQFLERRSDLKLFSAPDGYQGVQMARTLLPEVILLDMHLPGINGFEAMTMLREDIATSHIPVIALSSNAYPQEIRRCLDGGFFRYLTKPFLLDELMRTVDAALLHAAEICTRKSNMAPNHTIPV